MPANRARPMLFAVAIAGAVGYCTWGLTHASWAHVATGAVLFWVVACATANLLPVPVTGHVSVTMSSPANIAMAYIFPPPVATAIVLLGSVTYKEIRRETPLLHAAFNRSQLALATAGASVVLRDHSLGRILLGIVAYNIINVTFVLLANGAIYGRRLGETFRRMVTPLPSFVGSYLFLGVLGITFARVYKAPGLGGWAVAPFLVPLLFARYALRHSKELEQTERERRALADQLIDERERERARIASDMHDLVLQRLAVAQIQADNIGSAISAGSIEQAGTLAATVKGEVAGAIGDIRTAIADLRRAAVDGSDLGTTLDRYVRAFQVETAIDVALDVNGLKPGQLPLPVALLLYECAQEALTNVVRHAGASHIDLTLHRQGDSVELKVRDNGRGPSGHGQPGVHLGLTLTKDKVALVGGGAWFEGVEGGGAQVVVRIPVRSTN